MKIDCEVLGYRSLFVLANGDVVPCCHMSAAKVHQWYWDNTDGKENLHEHTLQEIIDNRLFKAVHESWDGDDKKVCFACRKVCRVEKEKNDEFRYEDL